MILVAGNISSGGQPSTGTYAVISVSQNGKKFQDIVLKLYPDKSPVAVENFTGLAEGIKEFRDPETGNKKKEKFYDGLTIHRVIANFMIQGGDPIGNGRGGPGYRFRDEISKDLVFDRPGILAMANAGPDTNGSQFFITVAPAGWLDGKYTIFGEVVSGMETVNSISRLPTDSSDRPRTPVVMEKVKIVKEKP